MNIEWRKSSRSGMGDTAGDCVELASLSGEVGIRDSKAPQDGHLTVGREPLRKLVGQIKAGALDLD